VAVGAFMSKENVGSTPAGLLPLVMDLIRLELFSFVLKLNTGPSRDAPSLPDFVAASATLDCTPKPRGGGAGLGSEGVSSNCDSETLAGAFPAAPGA